MSCATEDVEHLVFTDTNLIIVTPRNASDTIGRVLCGTLDDDQNGHSIIVNIHAFDQRADSTTCYLCIDATGQGDFAFSIINSIPRGP